MLSAKEYFTAIILGDYIVMNARGTEMETKYEAELISISEGDFEETFGRKPKNQDEWDMFVHYIKNGVDAQLDWGILYDCTRGLKKTILTNLCEFCEENETRDGEKFCDECKKEMEKDE